MPRKYRCKTRQKWLNTIQYNHKKTKVAFKIEKSGLSVLSENDW